MATNRTMTSPSSDRKCIDIFNRLKTNTLKIVYDGGKLDLNINMKLRLLFITYDSAFAPWSPEQLKFYCHQ